MLNSFLLAIRFLILFFGHKQVALENIALRHQLAVFTREKKRPRLCDRDRLFWIALKKLWKDLRSALEFGQPQTVIGWRTQEIQAVLEELVPAETARTSAGLFEHSHSWSEPWLLPIPSGVHRRTHGELLKLGFEIS